MTGYCPAHPASMQRDGRAIVTRREAGCGGRCGHVGRTWPKLTQKLRSWPPDTLFLDGETFRFSDGDDLGIRPWREAICRRLWKVTSEERE
jgi:hypothetical protein